VSVGERPRARMALVLVAAGLLVAMAADPALAQAERIAAYDVDIAIESDGSLLVVERIDYDFGALDRHGIFRDIPVRLRYDDTYDRIYRVEDIGVEASPGTPDGFELEHEGAILRIRIGDPDRTITGRHAYTITYRVRGALNGFDDHDELYWNAIGTEWSVPIEEASARVSAPAEILQVACFAGPAGSNLPCSETRQEGSAATFSQPSLDPYEGLTIVVGLPQGAVVPPRPILDERWKFSRAFSVTPLTVSVTGILLALVLFGVGWLWWTQGRDRRAVGSPVDIAYGTAPEGQQAVPLFEQGVYPVEYAPPEELRPGQIGTLVDEAANPLDVTATIVDLAVRGYLRIEEIPKRWLLGKTDWRLVMLKEADDQLLGYERLLFNGLFSVGDLEDPEPEEEEESDPGGADLAPGDPGLASVKLSSLRKKFHTKLAEVQDALYADVVRRRWFAGRPDKVRQRWSAAGFAVMLVGDGLIFLAAWKTHLGLVPIPIALAGLVLAFGARWMPRRTAKGTGLVRRVLGFRTYIETAEAQEARFAERENLFSRYLPYAVVFGLTDKWARAFARLGDQPDTSWYVGTRPFTYSAFASSIDGFSVSTAGTIASTPSGSGSSGFGGGGSSGGGGGGGGGGSW
jgi:hypothetical protein